MVGLSAVLEVHGWSQRRLAEALGCREPQVHRWTSGSNTPNRGSVVRIVKAMGLGVVESDELHRAYGHIPRDVEEKLLGSADLVRLVRGMPLSWVQTLLPRLGGVG